MSLVKGKTKGRSVALVQADEISRAPWFELLLFQTLCRFRIPKPSVKLPKGFDGKSIDVRPFVNTLAKTHYSSLDEAGVTGRYSQTFYRSAWGFYPRRWFAKPQATLNFDLYGIAVCNQDLVDYSDLRDAAIGLSWIQHTYRKQQIFNTRFALAAVAGDHLSVDIKSEKDAEAMVDGISYDAEVSNINGHIAYRLRPGANCFDVLVPFTKLDMLQFSFRLIAQTELTQGQKADFLLQASQLVEAILSTISLSYSEDGLAAGTV